MTATGVMTAVATGGHMSETGGTSGGTSGTLRGTTGEMIGTGTGGMAGVGMSWTVAGGGIERRTAAVCGTASASVASGGLQGKRKRRSSLQSSPLMARPPRRKKCGGWGVWWGQGMVCWFGLGLSSARGE